MNYSFNFLVNLSLMKFVKKLPTKKDKTNRKTELTSLVWKFFKEFWPIILLVFIFSVTYSFVSLERHFQFRSSSYDLGIFDQAMWHYSRIELPHNTIRGFNNLLADHFHPILVLLAPLYWVWNGAETLLVAQAVLIASAAIPIYLFAIHVLKKRSLGVLASLSFLTFWGIQHAVWFEFHEIAMAVPAIAWMLYAIERENWRIFWPAMIVVLLTKEELWVFAVFVGILLLARKHYKQGLAVFMTGLLGFVTVTKLIMPAMDRTAPDYQYWSYTAFGQDPLSSIKVIATRPWLVFTKFFENSTKITTLFAALIPWGGLSLFSSYMILAVPLLAQRFLSENSIYWQRNFHYSATLAPVLAVSAICGMRYVKPIALRIYKPIGKYFYEIVLTVSVMASLIATAFGPFFDLYSADKRTSQDIVQSGGKVLALIKREDSVAAQDLFIPHIPNRKEVYGLNQIPKSGVDKIVVSSQMNSYPFENFEELQTSLAKSVNLSNYEKIFDSSGWQVFERRLL